MAKQKDEIELEKEMNEVKTQIIIKKEDFDFIIKKPDVWLVYTKNNKRAWICCIGGITVDANFYYLDLATKGKCE